MIPRLWLITDRRLAGDLVGVVRRALAVLDAADVAVVLREKDLPTRELAALASELRPVTRDAGAKLVVSGRFDITLASGADGVHTGFEAPPAPAVRAVVGVRCLVGASIHRDEAPPPGCDYAFLSPVFETTSKPGAKPLGLEGLRRGVRAAGLPVVALGGIVGSCIHACLATGAAGVAVRSAWLKADDASLAAIRRAAEAGNRSPRGALGTRLRPAVRVCAGRSTRKGRTPNGS